jgi:HK97 family phage portal protein
VQKRNLIKWIFGEKTQENQGSSTQRLKMMSDNINIYSSWNGNLLQSDLIRSCIRPKINAVSKLNAIYKKGDEINKDLEILQNPNPYMTMGDFLSKMMWQRELNNNAFAYIKRNKGVIEGIYPIPYNSIEMLEKNNDVFVKFMFLNGQYMVVPYDDCIHLRKDFVQSDFFGENNGYALHRLMSVIDTTDQGIVNSIENTAIIRWILKFTMALNKGDKRKQVEEFVENYLNMTNTSGVMAVDNRVDANQVEQKQFDADEGVMAEYKERLYNYFGVNEEIIQNKFTEDIWLSFYEAEIEPFIIQMSKLFTNIFFTKNERKQGNKIILEGSNLAYASMNTKLNLVQMVDRGAMTPNEWRKVLNLPPIEGGDKPIRRLDTALIENGNIIEGGDFEDDNE